jgi:hypothetical protein
MHKYGKYGEFSIYCVDLDLIVSVLMSLPL